MKKRKLLTSLMAAVITGAMLMAPLSASAGEPQETPQNPRYSDEGVKWNKDGEFGGLKGDKTEWSYIYFGFYPQSEVKDAEIQARIDTALGGEDYIGDTVVDGVKYRKVTYFNANQKGRFLGERTPSFCRWTGGDEDSYGPVEEFRYFKWEPIKWKVLKVYEDKLFVMADHALDCQEYSEQEARAPWETCTLRSWLNGTDDSYSDPDRPGFSGRSFMETAFTGVQQDAILQTEIVNTTGSAGGNNTQDKIFLLNKEELSNREYGFCDDISKESNSRVMKATDYSDAMGVNTDYDYDEYLQLLSESGVRYWTRTQNDNEVRYESNFKQALVVDTDGKCKDDEYRFKEVNSSVYGIVPAMYLKRSSDLWSMKEDGIRIEEAETAPSAMKFSELFTSINITTPSKVKKGEKITDSVTCMCFTVTSTGKKPTVCCDGNDLSPLLTSIVIPDEITINKKKYKVTKIKEKAFYDFNATYGGYMYFASVTIGKNVKTIGKNAFRGCKKLKNITIRSTKLTKDKVGAKAFYGLHKKAVIRVPGKKLNDYRTILKTAGVSGKDQKIRKKSAGEK